MIDINKRLVDVYLELIGKLGLENKLDLISRLTSSMKESTAKANTSVLRLYGSFDSKSETAEELIEEIRKARFFNRKIESFD